MAAPRLLRKCLFAALSAVLVGSAATAQAQTRQPDAAAAAAAVVFSDTFDGPAGASVDTSKWQIETGDNVNNHERQYYTAGNRNAPWTARAIWSSRPAARTPPTTSAGTAPASTPRPG